MAKVSISEAIKLSGVSRSTFYTKYINKGAITIEEDKGKKCVDTSELIRVFGVLADNTTPNSTEQKKSDSIEQPSKTALEVEIKLLREALETANKDKEWLKSQNEELTKKNDNLMIRLLPAPPEEKRGLIALIKRMF